MPKKKGENKRKTNESPVFKQGHSEQALGESQFQPLLLGENQRTMLLLFIGSPSVGFMGNFFFDQRKYRLIFPRIGVESSLRTALNGQDVS